MLVSAPHMPHRPDMVFFFFALFLEDPIRKDFKISYFELFWGGLAIDITAGARFGIGVVGLSAGIHQSCFGVVWANVTIFDIFW